MKYRGTLLSVTGRCVFTTDYVELSFATAGRKQQE